MLNTLSVNAQAFFLAASYWVKETHTFNVTAVARIAAVGDCQVVKRALLRAATSQTNAYHVEYASCLSKFRAVPHGMAQLYRVKIDQLILKQC
jgi:hypothetical protein